MLLIRPVGVFCRVNADCVLEIGCEHTCMCGGAATTRTHVSWSQAKILVGDDADDMEIDAS